MKGKKGGGSSAKMFLEEFNSEVYMKKPNIIFETERLFLREYVEQDINTLYQILSDPYTMKYYPVALNWTQTKNWIIRNRTRYKNDGYGLWAVCLKENGKFIGDCGLVKQNIKGTAEVEIGYHIHKEYWSRGFATEAAARCKAHAFNEKNLTKLICIIEPQNKQSIRVAEKIGFKKERVETIFGKQHLIYADYNRRKDAVSI